MASGRGERLMRALAAEIKDLRTANGWSQEALAERADVHRTFVGHVESGLRGISVVSADGIAAAFGLQLSELLAQAERRL